MIRPKSVLYGEDFAALDVLLKIHAVENPTILDCTYNTGKCWKNLPYKPVRLDIDPDLEVDHVADFRNMHMIGDQSFDVLVFDPPHLPSDIGKDSVWQDKYNTPRFDDGRQKDNVCNLFAPFLQEAKRILKKDGIILTKLADLIHNHRYHWQQVDYINAVRDAGMTPCDMLIKCDPKAGNLQSSKWHNVKHLRKSHCYWIVVRNSKKCERCK